MALKLSNFISTVLSNSTNGSQTTIVVSSVTGFPSITTPVTDYFFVTVVRASDNAKEIMRVDDFTGTTLTVQRAQEGTTGLAFAAGDAVGLRFTAQTIINMIAEEAAARINATILESQFGALTIPASALKDNILALRHIPASLIDETKLAASVAGSGLTGGAGSPLALNPDGVTIDVSGDQARVKPASLTDAQLLYGKFVALNEYNTSTTGTSVFKPAGSTTWAPFGNAGSGARLVMVQIQNDHATAIAQIGIRIGGTLGYYNSGADSDVGVLLVNGFRIDDTSTRGSFSKAMSFTFLVPPGHRWLFENQNGLGTPNLTVHNWLELR